MCQPLLCSAQERTCDTSHAPLSSCLSTAVSTIKASQRFADLQTLWLHRGMRAAGTKPDSLLVMRGGAAHLHSRQRSRQRSIAEHEMGILARPTRPVKHADHGRRRASAEQMRRRLVKELGTRRKLNDVALGSLGSRRSGFEFCFCFKLLRDVDQGFGGTFDYCAEVCLVQSSPRGGRAEGGGGEGSITKKVQLLLTYPFCISCRKKCWERC